MGLRVVREPIWLPKLDTEGSGLYMCMCVRVYVVTTGVRLVCEPLCLLKLDAEGYDVGMCICEYVHICTRVCIYVYDSFMRDMTHACACSKEVIRQKCYDLTLDL